MSKSTTLATTVTCSGDEITSFSSTATYTNTNAYGITDESVTLSAGNNSYTAPTNSTNPVKFVRFTPTSGSTNSKAIKGVNGDTGITGWLDQQITLPMSSGLAYVINATAGETIRREYF